MSKRDSTVLEREASRYEFSNLVSTRPSIIYRNSDAFPSLDSFSSKRVSLPRMPSLPIQIVEEGSKKPEKIDYKQFLHNPIYKSQKKKQKNKAKKVIVDESNIAVLSVFKSMEAYDAFQRKYHEDFENFFLSSNLSQDTALQDHQLGMEKRKERFKLMHGVAQRNRERIQTFIQGNSTSVPLGIPQGFKVIPHPKTDELSLEMEEQGLGEVVNIQADASDLEALRLKALKEVQATENGNNAMSRRASFAISKRPSNTSFHEEKKVLEDTDEGEEETKEINLELSKQRIKQGRRSTLYKRKSSSSKLATTKELDGMNEEEERIGTRVKSRSSFVSSPSVMSLSAGASRDSIRDGSSGSCFFIPDAIVLDQDHEQSHLDELGDLVQDIPERKQGALAREKSILSRKSSKSSFLGEKQPSFRDSITTNNTGLPSLILLDSKDKSVSSHMSQIQRDKTWDPLCMDAICDFARVLPSSNERVKTLQSCSVHPSYAKAAEKQEYGQLTKDLDSYCPSYQKRQELKSARLAFPKSVKYWSTWSHYTDDLN